MPVNETFGLRFSFRFPLSAEEGVPPVSADQSMRVDFQRELSADCGGEGRSSSRNEVLPRMSRIAPSRHHFRPAMMLVVRRHPSGPHEFQSHRQSLRECEVHPVHASRGESRHLCHHREQLLSSRIPRVCGEVVIVLKSGEELDESASAGSSSRGKRSTGRSCG